MKILLLGEYSNVHNTLAEGLRVLGHDVTVASDGDSWKNYPRDIDLARHLGERFDRIGYMSRLARALVHMRGFDVVQLINPVFFELKAEKIMPFYRYLRRHNKKMVMGAFGMDYYWAHINTHTRPLRYSDFNFGETIRTDAEAEKFRKEWIGTAKERLNRQIALDCDGIPAGLYEYWATYDQVHETGRNGIAVRDKMEFIPYPIKPCANPDTTFHGGPLRLFIGISKNRSVYKGTHIMLAAAQKIVQDFPGKVELKIAEGVPFSTYQEMMDNSDAILDQLYSYTPSMNALLAMSKGIINIGGGEPENYHILNEKILRPIINVEPSYESVYNQLRNLVLNPGMISHLKQQSVDYVNTYHDYLKVAQKYIWFYESKLI